MQSSVAEKSKAMLQDCYWQQKPSNRSTDTKTAQMINAQPRGRQPAAVPALLGLEREVLWGFLAPKLNTEPFHFCPLALVFNELYPSLACSRCNKGESPTTETHLPSGLAAAQLQGAPSGPMIVV